MNENVTSFSVSFFHIWTFTSRGVTIATLEQSWVMCSTLTLSTKVLIHAVQRNVYRERGVGGRICFVFAITAQKTGNSTSRIFSNLL